MRVIKTPSNRLNNVSISNLDRKESRVLLLSVWVTCLVILSKEIKKSSLIT